MAIDHSLDKPLELKYRASRTLPFFLGRFEDQNALEEEFPSAFGGCIAFLKDSQAYMKFNAASKAWEAFSSTVVGGGSGDMSKAIYDTNDDGIVERANSANRLEEFQSFGAANFTWSGVDNFNTFSTRYRLQQIQEIQTVDSRNDRYHYWADSTAQSQVLAIDGTPNGIAYFFWLQHRGGANGLEVRIPDGFNLQTNFAPLEENLAAAVGYSYFRITQANRWYWIYVDPAASTVEILLSSEALKGADGTNGADGIDGAQGPAGPQGPAGANGINGIDGIDGTGYLIATDSIQDSNPSFPTHVNTIGAETPITSTVIQLDLAELAKAAVGKGTVLFHYGAAAPLFEIQDGSKALFYDSGRIGESDISKAHDPALINEYTLFVLATPAATTDYDYLVSIKHTGYKGLLTDSSGASILPWNPDQLLDISISNMGKTLQGSQVHGTWGNSGAKSLYKIEASQDFELRLDFPEAPDARVGIGLEPSGASSWAVDSRDIFAYLLGTNFFYYDKENGVNNDPDQDPLAFDWTTDSLVIRIQGSVLAIFFERAGVQGWTYTANITREVAYPVLVNRASSKVNVSLSLL